MSLQGLSKYYGTFCAVGDVSFIVQPGEFLTLLGPSGSGKTTILMMLAGFVQPSSGQISIDGEDITHKPPHRREIGVVFQNYALFPHMTVERNLAYPLQARRWSRPQIACRVNEMLALVQLKEYANRYPWQLSGGQQQRIAFARALIFDPPVVLMDEPFSSLDKQLREEMQLEMKQLHKQLGLTVISVTHDQTEAVTMSDRIAVLSHGWLQQVGKPQEVYTRPKSAFVARFLGDSNLLQVKPQRILGRKIQVATPDGLLVWASGDLLPGTKNVVCMIRPEEVYQVNDIESVENVFDARVEAAIYQGGVTKSWLRIGANTTVLMKHHNRAGEQRFEPGEKIRIGWSAEGARLFEEP